jgi:predicted ATPase
MAAPEIRILTTSREALRVEGERVHRLAPLEIPPEDVTLTAEDTLDFPSARLFVERATAGGARLDLGNEDARIVAGICRKLDGMALAIELAAGRVETYGLQQTAALLDERFTLLWPGQRTAPARQKTLRATLDWSYGLLTTEERIVFRRLAVFVGSFTIEAALSVVTGDASDSAWVFAAIDSLVAKSMVTAFPAGTMMRYRLLDTARAYALDIEMDLAERKALSARHVAYCLRWLEQFSSDGRLLLDASRRASHLADINNVRAALEWCFGDEGSTELGIDLAVAATPVLFSMSLLTECQRWSHLAIRKLDGSALDDRREMRLQAALGLSLMWTSGNSEASFSALNRSIVIAKQLDDPLNQILLLTPLHVFHMRVGEFGKAMQYARQISALTQTSRDPVAADLSRILLGYSFHFAGELSRARHELEVALRHNSLTELAGSQNSSLSSTMIDDAMAAPILALASAAAPSALAKTLWLQGRPAAARVYINRTIADAASANHPVTILVALLHAISVLIWSGDFDEADDQIAWFIKNAQTNALKSYFALGNCFKAQLAVSRGDTESGVDELRHWLSELHAQRYEMLTASFDITLAHGLGALGRHDEGLQLIVNTARLSSANGDMCYMPELLRVRASLLPSGAVDGDGEVERCLAESIAWSRRQGALAWELRASIDLAALRARQDRLSDARAVLEPVVAAFTERFDTADLRTAERLLATLG